MTQPRSHAALLFVGLYSLVLCSSANFANPKTTQALYSPNCQELDTCSLVKQLREYQKTHTYLMKRLSVGSPTYAACYAAQGNPRETLLDQTHTIILCHDPKTHDFIDSERLLAEWVLKAKKP